MPRHKSSSLIETKPAVRRQSKIERVVLLSPGFFVVAAGIVFLAHSLDVFSICDAVLLFVIGIGWILGCRTVTQLEVLGTELKLENARLEAVHQQSGETSRDTEGRLNSILQHSALLMGSVDIEGSIVTHVYDNAAAERFFAKKPINNSESAGVAGAATGIWLERYQESYWINSPVRFEHQYTTEEGARWLAVTVAHTGPGNSGQLRFCYIAEDITDRKKTEKSLVQQQERLTEVLDTTPDAVFLVDAEWRLIYLNSHAIGGFGFLPDQLGQVFWDIYPELIGSTVWPNYSKAMTDRVPAEFDLFYDRKELRYQVRALPCQAGLAIFVQDVTAEREAVAILRENAGQTLRQLVELDNLYQQAPMCLALFDTNFRFVRINETLADLNGVKIEAVLGRLLQDVLPSSYDLVAPLLQQVIDTGKPMSGQFVSTRSREGDAWQYHLANAYPLKDESGAVVSVNLILLDTTAERQAELALRESEQRFRQLAEATPEIIWTADAAGNIDYCNGRWFAYTKASGREAFSDWSNVIHPADLPRCREAWNRAVAAGEDYEIEYQFLRYDGVYRWFLCRAHPFCDSDGLVLKWYGACTDIDQQKRIEQVLRRSNEDLKQFTSAASHDLQERLRIVTSFCQMLARQYHGQLAAEADNYLETILEAATPMHRLLQELLSYAPVVAPEQQLSVRPAELEVVARGYNELVANRGGSGGHSSD